MIDLAIHFAMLTLGLASHYLKELARITKEDGKPPHPSHYWINYPYQSILSVTGSLAGFIMLYESGQISALTAFGIGYMADSAADIIGKRSEGKL